MAGWCDDRDLLREEAVQRRDEGCHVPLWIDDAIEALPPGIDGWSNPVTEPLWQALARLDADPQLAAAEPNDLAAIRALRPAGPRDCSAALDQERLLDQLHGAWLARAAGCALGKPAESGQMGFCMEGGRSVGRLRIRQYLEARGEWPLRDFFSIHSALPGVNVVCEASTREQIAFMEPDDDMHYTVVGLGVLEKYGPDFQWFHVAEFWSAHIPYLAICTAERQSILNFWNHSGSPDTGGCGKAVPHHSWVRSYKNPFREWIGAQIRADGWAWACAGRPELAAEFAYRDASWTHTRNGIYGEMFFAALQAAAFVERDMQRLIDIGLSEIPANCRLARWIRQARTIALEHEDFWSALEAINAIPEFATMNPVHTMNNAAVCVIALLHEAERVDAAVCNVVMAGLDTDCNGATVGSVVGAMRGAKNLGSSLAPRLNDTIKTRLCGMGDLRMADLAQRHHTVWKRVDEWQREREQGTPAEANVGAAS
jgi:hypothetical protein